jgi:hypothetical protein
MDKILNTGPDRDPLVDRTHVAEVLRHVGLDTEQIATVLDDVEFPGRLSHIFPQVAKYGISRGRLIDRMGGSP